MTDTPQNQMAGNIGNKFPNRLPQNVKPAAPVPQSPIAAQSHVPTRNSTNSQSRNIPPEPVQSPQRANIQNQPVVNDNQRQKVANTVPAQQQMTRPRKIQRQISPQPQNDQPVTRPVERRNLQNNVNDQISPQNPREPKQNKISQSYQNMMSPKPLEGNSLKLLIVLGIASVIIYIATLVL